MISIIQPPESLDFLEPVETPLLFPDGAGGMYHPKGYIVPSTMLLSSIRRPHQLWHELVSGIAAKKQQRILVPELEDAPLTPQAVLDMKRVFLGIKSVFAQNRGADCRYMPPSSGGIMNAELAREYIQLCLTEAGGKVTRNNFKRYQSYLRLPAPLYYEPGPLDGRHRGKFALIDMASAYWTIHSTTTIDMKFEPGSWCLTGRAPYLYTDEVTAYRGLRHAVPGSLSGTDTQEHRYGIKVDFNPPDRLSYPGVIGYQYHVMHSIAREVIDHFGALMVLTDAFIIPQERRQELVDFLWERWRMTGVLKAQGEGVLYGMNVYQVGDEHSRNAPPSWTASRKWKYIAESGREMEQICDSSPQDTLLPVDTSWVQKERTNILKKTRAE